MGGGIISGHKIPHINTKISIYPDWKIFQISHFDKFGEQPQTLESLKSIREYTSCFMLKYAKYTCVVLLFNDCVATFISDHTLCNCWSIILLNYI
jgi:hypothetical protein